MHKYMNLNTFKEEEVGNMKYEFLVANDPGNSEHDIIIDGQLYQSPSVIVKNTWGSLEWLDTEQFVKNLEDNIYCTQVSSNCENGDYHIGRSALKSRKPVINIDIGIVNAKFDSEVPFASTNALIATHAIKRMFEEGHDDESIEVSVKMVVGIPAVQFTNENSKKYSNKFQNDKAKVTMHLPNKRIDVTVKYDYVITLSEGAEILRFLLDESMPKETLDKLFSEYLNEYSEETLDTKRFRNGHNLIVSIGEGTTERIHCIKEEVDYQDLSGSLNGLGRAIDRMLPALKQERNLGKFSRQDVSKCYRDSESKHHEACQRLLNREVQTEANELFNLIKNDITASNNEIDSVVVYGGGAIVLKETLYPKLIKLGESTGIRVMYMNEDYSQIIEVLGFQAFLESDVFEFLSSKRVKESA